VAFSTNIAEATFAPAVQHHRKIRALSGALKFLSESVVRYLYLHLYLYLSK